ncbi:MAG: hypothetical protein ACLFWD_03380 [Anaerolineales bacterium]
MDKPESPAGRACPQCGETLNRWPTLETSGYLSVCPSCGFERVDEPAPADEPKPPEAKWAQTRRLRDLVSDENSSAAWPEELLEDLPAEARELLQTKQNPQKALPNDMEKRHRSPGYSLAEDSSGARLTGQGPKPGTGDLTPHDVIQLAAEMESGLPSGDERRQCPSCQAVLPPGQERCQWCGHTLPGSDPQDRSS